MKKFLLISAIVLLILYTSAWFIVAKIAEDKIPSLLSQLTTQEKGLKKFSAPVKVKGFPFHFDIALEHPNIHLEAQDHRGVYNILYDGTIRIRLGLFSSSIKLITNGDLHLKGHINNYHFHLVSTGDNTSYKVKLKHFLLSPRLYNDFIKAAKSTKFIMNTVDKITIHAEDLKTINKLNNEQLFSLDKIDLQIQASVKENSMSISYNEELENARFYNEFMTLWSNASQIPAIQKIIRDINPNVKNYFSIFSLPVLGNINHSVKLDINQDKDAYNIEIHKLKIKDAIENISLKGKVYVSNNKTHIDIKSNSKFTAQWHALMQRYINRFSTKGSSSLKLPFAPNSPLGNAFAPLGNIFNVFSKDSKIITIPELHNMGNVKLDMNINHDKKQNGDFDLDISNFDLGTNKFYIDVKGNIKERSNRDIYSLKVRIDNYDYVLNEILEYLDAVKSRSGGALTQVINFELSSEVREEIKGFIKRVSDNPNTSSHNLSWTIVNDGKSNYPAVGKYSSSQFEAELNALIAKLAIQAVAKNIKQFKNMAETIKKGPEGLIGSGNDATKVLEGLSNTFGF